LLLRSIFTQITKLSLRFWPVTILLTAAALFFGVTAYGQLNQEFLPSIEFPQTFVVTFRAGASSEDLLNLITVPLEKEFATVRGVIPAGLESTTAAPVAFLTVRTEYGQNAARIKADLEAAIKRVVEMGVPVGLKTTADLTPEIMTRVLKMAPSMFRHFKSEHLLAMSPDVLNAALAVDPKFIEQLDLLGRDQLAAARVSGAVTGTATTVPPVELPSAWRITGKGNAGGTPVILNFSFSDIPVVTSSVASTDKAITPEQFRERVTKELVDRLKATEGVANVSLAGGQQIPPEVVEAAKKAIEKSRSAAPAATPAPPVNAGGNGSNGGSGTTGTPVTDPGQVASAPALPETWRVSRVAILTVQNWLATLLQRDLGITAKFDTADDLLQAKDKDGKTLTAAELFNAIAGRPGAVNALNNTPAEVLAYLREKEPTFNDSLSDAALNAMAVGVLRSGAWAQLLRQPGFSGLNIATLPDLAKVKGTAAATLNAIVAETPAELRSFAIRVVDALTPEAITVLTRAESGFLAALDPQVLRYMAPETLKALPAAFVDGLEATLRDELKAIMADPTKAARASLQTSTGPAVVDDPNAPAMPDSWVQALSSFGLNVKTANDLFKPPFASPAAFFNQAAAQGGALFKDLDASLFLYLQGRDPNFFDGLSPAVLALLTPETLAALPAEVQARVNSGPEFTPSTSVTRTNGFESLVISIIKESAANTVVVSDRVEEVFKEAKTEDPALEITTVFETASFIRESIDGVVREGGLGAIGAVLMILVFLNFSLSSTAVTAVSIPTSIALALLLMRWVPETVHVWLASLPESGLRDFVIKLFPASITLNIMTLSGLTVAIGRVIDDSIVVLENIYRQMQKGNIDKKEAVIKGTRDVSLAIFAATLTTVVVFLPIGLTGGVIGEFFLPFGLAITYALIASFFVAITIIPVLTWLFVNPNKVHEEKEGLLERLYIPALRWSLKNRALTLVIAAISLGIGVALFATRPTTFLPSFGEPQITTSVSMPTGTPIAQTDLLVREFEAYLETKRNAGVTKYQVNVGGGGGFGDIAALLGGGGNVNGAAASITAGVNLTGEALNALTAEIRTKAGEIFGVDNVTVSRASISERGFGGFAVVVTGPDADLRAIDAKVIETLSRVPGLANVTSSLGRVGDAQSYLRVGGQSAVQYSAELEVTDTLGVTRQAIVSVKSIADLPATVTIGEGFQSQQQTAGFAQTFGAMGIAVVAVYIVMVATFGNLAYPFAILFSLPLAVVGAALFLTITDRVVGISALVGMLMLIGIVVTNAIVLLDRVQLNRKEHHMTARDALIEAGRTRLRPILMTAIATMVALAPLALGLSKGAIIATELGTVVIGGLFSSTFLTLLVVPVIYSLLDAAQGRLFRRK